MDLISRQAAIEAHYEYCNKHPDAGFPVWSLKILKDLPSAQPEIIRCNDCKHWTQTTGNMRGFGLGDCDYINAKLVNCNGFCYWAERRTDDSD